VGALCIAALWRVKSRLRDRSDRPKLEYQPAKGCVDPCYCKINLRFSSNSALSISPLANRSFKMSRAREAVSCTSGSSSRRALRQPQKHMAKSSIRFREIRASPPFGSPRRANLAVDHVRHRHRDGLWRLIDFLHDLLDRIARYRVDLQFHSIGLSEERPVLHCSHERIAQCSYAVGRNAGRSEERPSHRLAREDQLEYLLLLVVPGQVHDQRNVRQVGVLAERQLH